MANEKNKSALRSQLSKLTDNGINNNYGEWETKAFHSFRTWDLWKYIEGPNSTAPVIPILHKDQTHHGVDDNNTIATVYVRGNQAEYDQAVHNAEPWMAANNLCLSKIVHAIPTHQLHLIKSAIYAKQAWESLRSVYQPRNSLHASTLKSDIITYRCQPSMNIVRWLNDMQRLYNTLCGTDTDCMTDHHFTLAILDNMPQNGTWHDFLSGLQNKVREHDSRGTPISSIDFIISICKEFWFCHHNEPQNNTLVFSARSKADKRGVKRNHAVGQGESTPTNKHVHNTDKNCSNTHCGAPRGHLFEDCIAYSGGSCAASVRSREAHQVSLRDSQLATSGSKPHWHYYEDLGGLYIHREA